MVRVEGFLLNGECALVVFLGLCESALVGIYISEVVQ